MYNKEYVLITPARNEEDYIKETIRAVTSQTLLPKQWCVVSDGSTDSTDEIVMDYASRHKFIQLLRTSSPSERNFTSKVKAFRAGYEHLKNVDYAFVGNLDADVSFDESYFETVIRKFQENSKLGVAGGIIYEKIGSSFIAQNVSLNSVAGAVQLFRRQCYEAIGGYVSLQFGGVDAAVEILARMNGWEVRTFPEIKVIHHRRVTTGKKSVLMTRYYQGITNYLLGYHPLFQILSSLSRISDRPFLLGSTFTMAGFFLAKFHGYTKQMPDDVIKFLRAEQRQRLRLGFLKGRRI